MNPSIKTLVLFVISSFLFSSVQAQQLPSLSQWQGNGKEIFGNWSFGLGTGASLSLKNNEASLFRGNSMATKMFGRYFFGNVGISASTGVLAGSLNQNSLNQFMTERGFTGDQIRLTKGNPMNGFLLIGPSFRFGKKLYVNADIQGGVFLNNPGTVNVALIQENRTLYRFDNGGKNYFPGFSGSLSVNYPFGRTTHFFINADYLQSRSSVNLLDLKGGYDVATLVNRDVKMMAAGIGIVKTFGRSGGSTGRKHVGNVKYENFSVFEEGGSSNCGPVVVTRTQPDGSTDQMTFACPEDAANYTQRRLRNSREETYNPWEMDDESEGIVMNPLFESINSTGRINELNSMPSRLSMTPSTQRKTQGMDFGQKAAAGLQAGANEGVISGTIYWQTGNPSGIITNEMAASGIAGISTKPGGMTSSSYAAGKMMNNNDDLTNGEFAETVLYVRETGKGVSQREYKQSLDKIINSSCNDCEVTITGTNQTPNISQQPSQMGKNPLYNGNGNSGTNPIYNPSALNGNNPLYQDKGNSGVNPLFGEKAMGKGNGLLCGSTNHFLVGLYDAGSGMQVARTTADSCGNFWFANVPEGDYVVYVKGYAIASKAYELSINKDGKYDVGGIMQAGNAQLMISFQSLWNDSSSQNSKDIVSGGDPKNIDVIGGSQRVAGNPIPGLIVKGGKNPGPDRRTVMTNGNGQFGFSGWGKGNYIITAEIPFMVDQKAMVSVGKGVQQWGDPHENLNGKQVKGWDGSVKGNSLTESQDYNSSSSNKANLTFSLGGVGVTGNALTMKLNPQEKVSSGSDKSYLIIGDDGSLSGKLNAQDFNTCRSNRERGQFARNSSNSNTASADKIFFRIGNDGSLTEILNVQNNNSGSGKADWSYLIIKEDRTISGLVNAQDFNTCRSNRERGQFAKNPEGNNPPVTDRITFSVKKEGVISGKPNQNFAKTSNPGESYIIIHEDKTISGMVNAQDFNTCRSIRERRQFATNPKGDKAPVTDRINFTIKKDGALAGKVIQNSKKASNSGGSYMIINEDRIISGMVNAQDFNTCRSNRERGQ